jgi:hypothetical protein
MEDKHSSSLDSRKKLSRKGNKLSFLPQAWGQLRKEEEEEAVAIDLLSKEIRNNNNNMQTQFV